jgi:hypothetical protein
MDVRVASALQSLTEFLDDPRVSVGVQDREWRREELERLCTPGVGEDALRRALRDPAERSLALHVIEGRKLFALFPALMEMGVDALDPHAVHVLARYGGTAELEFLSLALPRVVDLAARTGPIQTSSDVHENRDEDRLVAEITAAMGRHGTAVAIGHLKRGATDPHPWVRAAACDGMANLPPERWDDEMRSLVRERLDDAPEYVAEEARRAAVVAGLDTAR